MNMYIKLIRKLNEYKLNNMITQIQRLNLTFQDCDYLVLSSGGNSRFYKYKNFLRTKNDISCSSKKLLYSFLPNTSITYCILTNQE